MPLILDAQEWWKSDAPNMLGEDMESYIRSVRDNVLALWDNPNERERLLINIRDKVIDALRRTAFALSTLGADAGQYFPISPDLVVAAVIIMLGLYKPQNEENNTRARRKRKQKKHN